MFNCATNGEVQHALAVTSCFPACIQLKWKVSLHLAPIDDLGSEEHGHGQKSNIPEMKGE